MKKNIWILILVLIIIGIGVYFYLNNSDKNFLNNFNNFQENPEENLTNISGGSSSSNIGGGNSEGNSGGSASGEENSGEETDNLPNDLYEKPCGFYMEGYEVCAGYCPSGECLQDGKSCYCKILN